MLSRPRRPRRAPIDDDDCQDDLCAFAVIDQTSLRQNRIHKSLVLIFFTHIHHFLFVSLDRANIC
ncbi:hypothetical protein Syun_007110 [Stephania yunnanensis]|uniref:Uncharacterized protein n=1 Tax=Stephania yunnanensis TaxID=152371 RepID=A0AAP0L1D4_9MAGN